MLNEAMVKYAQQFPSFFSIVFDNTKNGCYCHFSKGLCICTWPPVPFSLGTMFTSGTPHRITSSSTVR